MFPNWDPKTTGCASYLAFSWIIWRATTHKTMKTQNKSRDECPYLVRCLEHMHTHQNVNVWKIWCRYYILEFTKHFPAVVRRERQKEEQQQQQQSRLYNTTLNLPQSIYISPMEYERRSVIAQHTINQILNVKKNYEHFLNWAMSININKRSWLFFIEYERYMSNRHCLCGSSCFLLFAVHVLLQTKEKRKGTDKHRICIECIC